MSRKKTINNIEYEIFSINTSPRKDFVTLDKLHLEETKINSTPRHEMIPKADEIKK